MLSEKLPSWQDILAANLQLLRQAPLLIVRDERGSLRA
jgi:hypothetical protein